MSLSLTDTGGSVQFGSTDNADGTYTGGLNIAQADTSESDLQGMWMIDYLGFTFGNQAWSTIPVMFGMSIS